MLDRGLTEVREESERRDEKYEVMQREELDTIECN